MLITLLKLLFNQPQMTKQTTIKQSVVKKPTDEENLRFLQINFPKTYEFYIEIKKDIIKYPKDQPDWLQRKIQYGISSIFTKLNATNITYMYSNAIQRSLATELENSFEHKEYFRLIQGKLRSDMLEHEKFFIMVKVFIEVEREQYDRINKNANKSRFFFIKDTYPDLFEQCREAELATNKKDIGLHGLLAANIMAHKTGSDMDDFESGHIGIGRSLSKIEGMRYELERGDITVDAYFQELYEVVKLIFLPYIEWREQEQRKIHE